MLRCQTHYVQHAGMCCRDVARWPPNKIQDTQQQLKAWFPAPDEFPLAIKGKSQARLAVVELEQLESVKHGCRTGTRALAREIQSDR